MDMNRLLGRPLASRPAAITAIAFWVAAGIFALVALFSSSSSTLVLLLIATVLTVGGSILSALDALRFDLLMARIAAETGATPSAATPSLGAQAPPPGSLDELPKAKTYARPPWEKQPSAGGPEGP